MALLRNRSKPAKRGSIVVLLVLTALAGCKPKKHLDGRLDDLEVLNKATCACNGDPACLAYQHKAFIAWNMRNDSTDAAKATPVQRERYTRLYHEFQRCSGAEPAEPAGSNQ